MSKIRLFRIRNKLSQKQLADKIGVSLDTISRYETGKREPRLSDLANYITKILHEYIKQGQVIQLVNQGSRPDR